MFPEFRPVEAIVGATVTAVTCVKMAAAAAISTIHRERSTQAITRIGKF